MNKKEIGTELKKLRENANLTIKDVIIKLKEYNINISDKTLYGYESNNRSLTSDTFLALCSIYRCKNILEVFSDIEPDYSLISTEEQYIIDKYRILDSHGVNIINSILDLEYERCNSVEEKSTLHENFRYIPYYPSKVSAGNGQVIYNDFSEEIKIPLKNNYKRVAYAVSVNGDSMEPQFHDGDILLIEPTTDIELGEIGIFAINSEAFVKKLGHGVLISNNPNYKDIILNETAQCMGKVLGKL